ncbi:MAG TPA: hypothetical protein PLA74_11080 [Syntrophales bacterium]|nr:hypothetical protein [Syntrophales bacterium]HPQ44026.1 hypothetical protein [Syntrophales bacterium]
MKRNNHILYVCIAAMISLLIFLLTGCKEQMAALTQVLPGSSSNQEEPRSIYLPNKAIPADIKLVSAAMGVSAYGEDPQKVSSIKLEQDVEKPWKALVPSTFVLVQHKILQYGQSTEFQQSMTLSGSLDFQDILGRRMILFYDATYRIVDNGVRISRSGIMPVFPDDPEVVAFIVPKKKMPKNTMKLFNSFETLYRFAADNAVAMGKPDRLPEGADMYYVFAFVMDRLSVTAGLRFMVDDADIKSKGYSDSSRYYDYDGWRVAVLPGTFRLLDEKPLYFKLAYRPGKEQPFTKQYERQVAMFGTFDRETLRKAQNRSDLNLVLPFNNAVAPINHKIKNRWESAIAQYPEVSDSDGILKSLTGMLNKKDESSGPERMIPYTYTISSRGSLLALSVDSREGVLWLSFFPAKRMVTDVPLTLRIGNSSPIELQQYLVGPQGTDLTRYQHMGNVVHYRLYAGIQAPLEEKLLVGLMKGSRVTIQYSTQSRLEEDTFSLKGSSDAIQAVLNGYAG